MHSTESCSLVIVIILSLLQRAHIGASVLLTEQLQLGDDGRVLLALVRSDEDL